MHFISEHTLYDLNLRIFCAENSDYHAELWYDGKNC